MHQGCKPPTPADVALNSLGRRSSHRKERTRAERWKVNSNRTGDPNNESSNWQRRHNRVCASRGFDRFFGATLNSRNPSLAVPAPNKRVSSRVPRKAWSKSRRTRPPQAEPAKALIPAANYVATAYSLKGRTASGRMVSRGLIAADPAVLPLGSRVRVEHPGYSGEYLVADTGGMIRGRRIDIWTPSSREAMRFGRRTVKLTVLSYGARRGRAKRTTKG